MDKAIKSAILITCICFKPPMFLTSTVVGALLYLTATLLEFIGKELLAKQSLIGIISINGFLFTTMTLGAFMWLLFFFKVARIEVSNELWQWEYTFKQSKRGFRFIPVGLAHIALTMAFEVALYLIMDQVVDPLGMDYTVSVSNAKKIMSRKQIVLLYSLWFAACIYTFVYLVAELFVGSDNLMHNLHWAFVKALSNWTSIDLSDAPAGDDLNNPIIQHIRRVRQVDDHLD